ncbi:MAG: hypothetical protein WA638_08975 [Candidatus Acidiferrales bacterium]
MQTGGFGPQSFGGEFRNSAVTPDVDSQTLAGMFHYDLLDRSFERHLGALF